MSEIIGCVIRIARRGVNLSLRGLASSVRLPASTMSYLERGDVGALVFHLDVIADALTEADEAFNDRPRAWDGWELYRIASDIAETLEDDGYIVLWQSSKRIEDQTRYTRGDRLLGMVKVRWPQDYLDRL